jgi:hypothetical protein
MNKYGALHTGSEFVGHQTDETTGDVCNINVEIQYVDEIENKIYGTMHADELRVVGSLEGITDVTTAFIGEILDSQNSENDVIEMKWLETDVLSEHSTREENTRFVSLCINGHYLLSFDILKQTIKGRHYYASGKSDYTFSLEHVPERTTGSWKFR